jgi:hypothetical protein
MPRIHTHCTIVLLAFCATVAGCKGAHSVSSGGSSGGTAPVVLAMTDTPPTNVSILSAEVTLTGATLNPGSVPVFSGSATVELTRLQTDIAYLATTKVAPGTYTSLALTFSNPMLTFENDAPGSVTFGVGSPTCNVGAICTIQSVATNLSTTITLSNFTLSANTGAGLLVDVNLNNLLSATLGADFIAGSTVSQFTPGGSGAPPVGAEDVVGQVASTDATNSKFSLQNVLITVPLTLTVDNTTTFLNFPAGTCTTPSIACVQTNQILSVDISVRADGTPVARNVLFEDANSTDAEVEGIVTSTGSLTFKIVTLAVSDSTLSTSLPIGSLATVTFTGSTPSDVDFLHADNVQIITSTFGLPFDLTTAGDLIVGQQVQVRRNPSSSGASITADHVRLRSSRVSGIIQSPASTFFVLGSVPSLFIPRGTAVIQAKTSSGSVSAICTGTAANCSLLGAGLAASVRGPLFANAGTPTLIASKVIQH